MRLVLFQPDIAQNTGTMMRLCACVDMGIDIIEPCGFIFNDKAMRRAGMDYLDMVEYKRHDSWDDFLAFRAANPDKYGRIVLMTTKAKTPYTDFRFLPNDLILMGRESAGAPEDVHKIADARVIIPMNEKARSINVAVSATMVVGEALRQCGLFPKIK